VLAEFALRRGAELSRKYEPQWNLLNFFFDVRAGRNSGRRPRGALAISYGDRAALFDLCSRADGGGAERLERILPEAHEVRFRYTAILMGRSEYARAGVYVEDLAGSTSGEDVVVLNAWCEALLENFEVGAAERAWKTLRSRGLLTEDAPPWQTPDVKGATVHGMPDGLWQILLSGEQPSNAPCSRVLSDRPGTSRSNGPWTRTIGRVRFRWQVESYERRPRCSRGAASCGAARLTRFRRAKGPVRITLQFRRPLGSVRAKDA
jgi:hypothetical protein